LETVNIPKMVISVLRKGTWINLKNKNIIKSHMDNESDIEKLVQRKDWGIHEKQVVSCVRTHTHTHTHNT
jgi:hypothetical protein